MLAYVSSPASQVGVCSHPFGPVPVQRKCERVHQPVCQYPKRTLCAAPVHITRPRIQDRNILKGIAGFIFYFSSEIILGK
jgi:hypothetical protein